MFPIGFGSGHGAQGFTIDIVGGSGEILTYMETRSQALLDSTAYCDLEVHPSTSPGLVNAGSGWPGYDGIEDRIDFNLFSPLQWDVTNPGGGVTEYDIQVHANGSQDISSVVTVNGLEGTIFNEKWCAR